MPSFPAAAPALPRAIARGAPVLPPGPATGPALWLQDTRMDRLAAGAGGSPDSFVPARRRGPRSGRERPARCRPDSDAASGRDSRRIASRITVPGRPRDPYRRLPVPRPRRSCGRASLSESGPSPSASPVVVDPARPHWPGPTSRPLPGSGCIRAAAARRRSAPVGRRGARTGWSAPGRRPCRDSEGRPAQAGTLPAPGLGPSSCRRPLKFSESRWRLESPPY